LKKFFEKRENGKNFLKKAKKPTFGMDFKVMLSQMLLIERTKEGRKNG
jgi:hypothetical protein